MLERPRGTDPVGEGESEPNLVTSMAYKLYIFFWFVMEPFVLSLRQESGVRSQLQAVTDVSLVYPKIFAWLLNPHGGFDRGTRDAVLNR